MQRIEADAVSAKMRGELDHGFEIGEVADPPIARGADAVKLDREQPAAVEIAAESFFRRRDQRHVLGYRGGIGQLQPVDVRGQPLGPVNDAIRVLAFRDNPRIGNDFPVYRDTGRGPEFASRRPPVPDYHRLAHQRPRGLRRKRIQDNFERRRIRHTAVTLTIQEFGLNSAIIGFSEEVHSARGLHAKVRRAS